MKLQISPIALSALILAGCGAPGEAPAPAGPETVSGEVVVAWNEGVLQAAEAEDGFLTLKGLRTAAMMHVAVHDSMSAIFGRYRPLLEAGAGGGGSADPLAAAAQAAYEIAADQYPTEAEEWKAELAGWLAGVEEGPAKEGGIALGKKAATAVLQAREGDGWDGEAEYRWHPMAPGIYAEFNEHSGTPEGFVFGAGWGEARPFLLEAPDQFRSPPPPAIASAAYARAFREVKESGRFESPSRTLDQTHLALWWKDFVENSHNRLARRLALEEGLDVVEAARLFALLNLSVYDAYINVFNNKFHYNHWRPYTAIRWAEHDGNPETAADPKWNNTHRHTYAFPSYPSAHGTACAAAMTVLSEVFGSHRPVTMTTEAVDEGGPFSGKIPMDPQDRSFPGFAAAAEECTLSRIYLGIHFRYDSEEGNRLGREIGGYAVRNFLRPVEAPDAPTSL